MIVFDCLLLIKLTTGRYNFVSLILKIILLELTFSLSAAAADKAQYFVHLRFSFMLQLVNGISNDIQKLLKYFNGTSIVAFFRIPIASSASVLPKNLALYLKDLKLLVLAISALKLVASSFE